jgi:RHS repeat-associated protein
VLSDSDAIEAAVLDHERPDGPTWQERQKTINQYDEMERLRQKVLKEKQQAAAGGQGLSSAEMEQRQKDAEARMSSYELQFDAQVKAAHDQMVKAPDMASAYAQDFLWHDHALRPRYSWAHLRRGERLDWHHDGGIRLDGKLLPQIDGSGNIIYAHNNQIGVPQKITDPSRNLVRDQIREPFGEIYSTPTTTTPTNHRFPGQYADAENSLSYNNMRDYDTSIGRYIQADPIGINEGLNLYGYVADPLKAIDPFGLVLTLNLFSPEDRDRHGHLTHMS